MPQRRWVRPPAALKSTKPARRRTRYRSPSRPERQAWPLPYRSITTAKAATAPWVWAGRWVACPPSPAAPQATRKTASKAVSTTMATTAFVWTGYAWCWSPGVMARTGRNTAPKPRATPASFPTARQAMVPRGSKHGRNPARSSNMPTLPIPGLRRRVRRRCGCGRWTKSATPKAIILPCRTWKTMPMGSLISAGLITPATRRRGLRRMRRCSLVMK